MHAAKIIVISVCLSLLPSAATAQSNKANVSSEYAYGDGDNAFTIWQIIEGSKSRQNLLKFKSSDEIWILSRELGIGGGVIYRNDTGRIVFRDNLVGGDTLYPDPESRGVPVWRKAASTTLTRPLAHANEELQDLKSIEDWSRAYAYAGNKNVNAEIKRKDELWGDHDDRIEFPDWPSANAAYQADLSGHLTTFLTQYPQDGIERIIVKIGENAQLEHDNAQLTIWVNPDLGYAGRPSSEKILKNIKVNDG